MINTLKPLKMVDDRCKTREDIYLGGIVYENPWGVLIQVCRVTTERHHPDVFDWDLMDGISKYVLFDKNTGEVLTKNFSHWYVKEV